jgi:hypothetical protein
MDKVEFLRYRVNAVAVKPIQEKVKAIVDAPIQQNVSQIKSFLGMIQYYHRHLPGLASRVGAVTPSVAEGSYVKMRRDSRRGLQTCKKTADGGESSDTLQSGVSYRRTY